MNSDQMTSSVNNDNKNVEKDNTEYISTVDLTNPLDLTEEEQMRLAIEASKRDVLRNLHSNYVDSEVSMSILLIDLNNLNVYF